MSVYAPDVVFVETPFSEPFEGTDAVRGYWADVPYNQSEVTFSSGEIYCCRSLVLDRVQVRLSPAPDRGVG